MTFQSFFVNIFVYGRYSQNTLINRKFIHISGEDAIIKMKKIFAFLMDKYKLKMLLIIEAFVFIAAIIIDGTHFIKPNTSLYGIITFILLFIMNAAIVLYIVLLITKITMKFRKKLDEDIIVHQAQDEHLKHHLKNSYALSNQSYGYTLRSGLPLLLGFISILLIETWLYSSFIVHRNIIFSDKIYDVLTLVILAYLSLAAVKFISSFILIHRRYKVTSFEEEQVEK